MKLMLFLLVGLLLFSCAEEAPPANVSTVDSAVLLNDQYDSTLLDLDNPASDFSIALDSAGPTINAEDTNYVAQ